MAQQERYPIFLKIEGDTIAGESVVTGYEDLIQIDNWAFDVDNSGEGQARFSTIVVSKRLDKSGIDLVKACCLGTPIDKITIINLDTATDAKREVLNVTLTEDVRIATYDISKDGLSEVIENITISFGKIEFGYTEKGVQGAAIFGWSVDQTEIL